MTYSEIYNALKETKAHETSNEHETTFHFDCGWISTKVALINKRQILQIYTQSKARKCNELTSLTNIPFDELKRISVASGVVRFRCANIESMVFV